MADRLLQAYQDMELFPNGVPINMRWIVSPPCAGLLDMTRRVRNLNAGSSEITVGDASVDEYRLQLAGQ
eukprot:7335187-Prorocentrum_lima.AAC.1